MPKYTKFRPYSSAEKFDLARVMENNRLACICTCCNEMKKGTYCYTCNMVKDVQISVDNFCKNNHLPEKSKRLNVHYLCAKIDGKVSKKQKFSLGSNVQSPNVFDLKKKKQPYKSKKAKHLPTDNSMNKYGKDFRDAKQSKTSLYVGFDSIAKTKPVKTLKDARHNK